MNSTLIGYVDYADSTLKGFTKSQLIDEIKCLRHNLKVAHEQIENQFNLLIDIPYEFIKDRKQKYHDAEFKYFVINCENGVVGLYNLFNNWVFKDEVNKLCKEYYNKELCFDSFTEKLRTYLSYYFRCKRGYEIDVTDFNGYEHGEKPKKIDVYSQVAPNLKMFARSVLWQYKHYNEVGYNERKDCE